MNLERFEFLTVDGFGVHNDCGGKVLLSMIAELLKKVNKRKLK